MEEDGEGEKKKVLSQFPYILQTSFSRYTIKQFIILTDLSNSHICQCIACFSLEAKSKDDARRVYTYYNAFHAHSMIFHQQCILPITTLQLNCQVSSSSTDEVTFEKHQP
jgi:hypothetical protein